MSLFVYLAAALTVITAIIALITRCAASTWPPSGRCKMILCSICGSMQSRPGRAGALVYLSPCTTSVITAANLPSVFTGTQHCGLFLSIPPPLLDYKHDRIRDQSRLSAA